MTERIEQHRELALLSLAAPFWGKPRIGSLLVAFIGGVQRLEDDLWAIMTERTLDEADLVRLKVLGKIIGQPRLSFDTELYRTVLRARALANVSRGRASDLLAVLEVLVGTGAYVLTEVGNATLFVSVLTALTAQELLALRLVLADTRAAGVGFQLLISSAADPEDTFLWGDVFATTEEWGGALVL